MLANQMLTMNSACTVQKLAFGSSTSLCFLCGNNSSEVGVPVADFHPLFYLMQNSVLNSANSEVDISFANFPLYTLKHRILAEVGIYSEVGKPNADFLILFLLQF